MAHLPLLKKEIVQRKIVVKPVTRRRLHREEDTYNKFEARNLFDCVLLSLCADNETTMVNRNTSPR